MNLASLSRWVGVAVLFAAVCFSAPAWSQASSTELPPGHPPLQVDQEQPALPEGHPPISGPIVPAPPLDPGDESPQLPPGHPPIAGASAPGSASPGMAGMRSTPVSDDASLAAGSAVLLIRDGNGQPVPGLDVVLEVIHKSVAEGESRSLKIAKADTQGRARFEGLKIGSEWVYQASTKYGPVQYHSPQFQLPPSMGRRVTLLVYEATEDIDAAPVGIQAFLAMEPREEFLQVEHIFNFANVGNRTWIIPGFVVPIARGFQAFQGTDPGSDVQIELVDKVGFRVTGFVRPGQQEISFRYQIPYRSAESLRFTVPMPARVAQVRVLTAAIGSTRMRVDGLPEPVATRGSEGQSLLVTERVVPPGGDQIDEVTINIQGLPTPSTARWYALGLALAAVVAGLLMASKSAGQRQDNDPELRGDIERARKQLLEEIASLEMARKTGEVGPKTYEHARRTLIDSLARLIAMAKASSQQPSA